MLITSFHWKIKIAFVLTPLIAFTFYGLTYYLIWDSTGSLPFGVYVFFTLFGCIGFFTLSTLVLKGKVISIDKHFMRIRGLISRHQLMYSRDQIKSMEILIYPEQDYEVILFQTSDNRLHSVVSYEFREYKKVKKWLMNTPSAWGEFGHQKFISSNYKTPLIVGLLIFVLSLLPMLI